MERERLALLGKLAAKRHLGGKEDLRKVLTEIARTHKLSSTEAERLVEEANIAGVHSAGGEFLPISKDDVVSGLAPKRSVKRVNAEDYAHPPEKYEPPMGDETALWKALSGEPAKEPPKDPVRPAFELHEKAAGALTTLQAQRLSVGNKLMEARREVLSQLRQVEAEGHDPAQVIADLTKTSSNINPEHPLPRALDKFIKLAAQYERVTTGISELKKVKGRAYKKLQEALARGLA